MSGTFTLGTDRAYGIIGTDEAAVVTNGNTTGTVYIGKGPSTSSATNDFSIAAGAARLVKGPAYAIGSTNVTVSTRDVPVQDAAGAPATRWYVGGTPTDDGSGGGANKTLTALRAELGQVDILQRSTLTGIGYLIGTTGGTDKAIAVLYDSRGNPLAWSAVAGTTVGTANTYQELAFTVPFEVVDPGRHFIGIITNGTTATLQVQNGTTGIAGDVSVLGGTQASAWTVSSAPVAVTAPTAVGEIPIGYTY